MYLVIVSFKNLEINNSAYYFLQDRSYLFDYFKNGLSLKSVFQRPSSQLGMILLPGRYLAMRHLWSLQLGNEMVLLAYWVKAEDASKCTRVHRTSQKRMSFFSSKYQECRGEETPW